MLPLSLEQQPCRAGGIKKGFQGSIYLSPWTSQPPHISLFRPSPQWPLRIRSCCQLSFSTCSWLWSIHLSAHCSCHPFLSLRGVKRIPPHHCSAHISVLRSQCWPDSYLQALPPKNLEHFLGPGRE